jgi:dUTPase
MTVSEVSVSEYTTLTSDRQGQRGTGGFGSTGQK